MSKVLEEWPLNPHGNTKYEWSKWTDGKIHLCVRGIDFNVTVYAFARAAYGHAQKRGLRLRTQSRADSIVIQFCERFQ